MIDKKIAIGIGAVILILILAGIALTSINGNTILKDDQKEYVIEKITPKVTGFKQKTVPVENNPLNCNT